MPEADLVMERGAGEVSGSSKWLYFDVCESDLYIIILFVCDCESVRLPCLTKRYNGRHG